MTKQERHEKVHADALRQFDLVQEAMYDERMQCLQDRRFYSIAGAQWEGPLADQFENKPKFEVNKIHLSVFRIINEYRNNRITVAFVSKDGSDTVDMADTCNGLYRADEQDSGAEEAYDNAFEEAVGGGFGAFRLTTEYEDEEDEECDDQRIRIEPIFDADSSVFFDLGAKRQDKADAKYAFVVYAMPREQYKEEFDDDPASWPKDVEETSFDWFPGDSVFVAEYYVVEKKNKTVQVWKNLVGEEEKYTLDELEVDPEILKRNKATGMELVREKTISTRRIHKYILSGAKILEDCGVIAGKNIPIVPVYGKRWYVDNVERCMGHVRLAKDAQRLKNMQLSKLGEIAAISSVSKPILTAEQIVGHELMWSEDNIANYPYLLVNAITDAAGNAIATGPTSYTKSPELPQALAALLQLTEQDMRDILGNQQQAEQVVSNISGKAIEMIQAKMDMQTFIYVSNFAKSIRRAGEVWLSMAREIYTTAGRKMKTVSEQNDIGSVELMAPAVDRDTGATTTGNDLTKASFDVSVTVGPSSQSRKAALVRELTGMLAVTQDPETAQVIQLYALMNMEGEGLGEMQKYLRKKLVAIGVVEMNDEEKKAAAAAAQAASQAPEDPQAIALKAMAEEASAKAAKARVDTLETVANTEKIHAQTIEILAGVDQSSSQFPGMVPGQQ
jgi:hypothetical protein